jgi:methyl-accepting chemotaxis protein
MWESFSSARAREFEAKLTALAKSQAVIEFNMDGTILTANENFLKALGYSLAEVQGKHHRMFVAPEDRDGTAYAKFWADLNRGTYQAAEYKRLGKGGREVWIQASYNPILDRSGKPFKSSSSPPTSRSRSCRTPSISARSMPSASRRR